MILWTIQSEDVYRIIEKTGFYHCDFSKSAFSFSERQYRWLTDQMRKRIGEPPEGVSFPVWAWYKWENVRKKPDLRRERWGNGFQGERFVSMEIDIPDEEVVLTDCIKQGRQTTFMFVSNDVNACEFMLCFITEFICGQDF